MSRPVRFEAGALGDIIAAARYYNRERTGLGDEFREAVNQRVLALRGSPNAGVPVEHVRASLVARQVRVGRFPYLVVYVVTADDIRVIAVAHEKRLPSFWAERLGGG